MEILLVIIVAGVIAVSKMPYISFGTRTLNKRTHDKYKQASFPGSEFKSALDPATGAYMPYQLNTSLLTSREMDLFNVLKYALHNSTYFIAVKPRIADFINVTLYKNHNPSVFWHYFNQISAKHVDFLICDELMRPKLAIELDDSTHKLEERIKRDEFVNKLYKTVGLNVVHLNEYTELSIKNLLSEYLLINSNDVVPV